MDSTDIHVDIRNKEVDTVLDEVCSRARKAQNAQHALKNMTTEMKDDLLRAIADAVDARAQEIENANAIDMKDAKENGMAVGLLDRLLFDCARVRSSLDGMRHIATLPDPIGKVVRGLNMDNGMRLVQSRVPMGVVGMIYEARPNVTLDVIALCIKSGNAVIVRGGHAAQRTNAATLSIVHDVLQERGVDESLVQTVDDFGREGAQALMRARGYVDLLVPRGSAQLISYVAENATVPVIETGAGNVHIYVDKSANVEKAIPVIINAKTQRVGVCNAAEKLLVHKDIAEKFLPRVATALTQANVNLRCDERAFVILNSAGIPCHRATDEDWDREYLDYIMGIAVVDDEQCAIDHINRHSTGHTEAILSEDYSAIETFTRSIESAVIMVNASTRFTDGGQFGFGAELGISTQKMHARGPMGLEELTTTHWIGYGTGQVRA
ncbi:glutamate-5-semialdehyde dehydrogenase [Alloscardovia venturai]|uniref:Gamma-glutamyl phosphate reductase n=1 Tax=Alloscardovia venturai TaxID=1769421 RepID=A0ABW2Y3G6_9BIFI